MRLQDKSVVSMPVARIVFDDMQEFNQCQFVARRLGMGDDWPVEMLRHYVRSYLQAVHTQPANSPKMN